MPDTWLNCAKRTIASAEDLCGTSMVNKVECKGGNVSPVSVCLSVCLSVLELTQKVKLRLID